MKIKKLCLLTVSMLSILSLAACGKKAEITEETTTNGPSYAVNETRERTEEEYNEEEDYNIQLPTNTEEPKEEIKNEFESHFVAYTDANLTEKVEYTFTYPSEHNDVFYINGVKIATAAPYGFIFNDIKVNSVDECGYDNVKQTSIDNKIYCQGLTGTLNLVDNDLVSSKGNQRLTLLAPIIEEIKYGNESFMLEDLLYSANDLDKLLEMLNTRYTFDGTYNKSNPISCAKLLGNNEYWGNSYRWGFLIDDIDLEYSDEEKEIFGNKLYSSKLYVTAVYDSTDTLAYYTISTKKSSHLWYINHKIVNQKYEYEYEMDPETGDLIETKIPIEGEEEIVETNNMITHEEGYDFTNAYLKFADGTYIGLDNFSITIHNPKSIANKGVVFDYVIADK